MKTTVFNINRIGLLFHRYFIVRFNSEVIYWSIMAIVFMFIRNVTPLMVGLILFAGAFYAGRFFREIHSRSNGVAYFMIPATQLEKLVVSIVMTTFYYFAMMMITYVIGNLLGTFFNNILASVNLMGLNIFHHIPLQWNLFDSVSFSGSFNIVSISTPIQTINYNYLAKTFRDFILAQSVFLLGSVYFKNNQTLKTFLSIVIIYILLLILLLIEVKLFGISNMNIAGSVYEWGKTIGSILRYSLYLLPLFFWVVSYFRLTEKQV